MILTIGSNAYATASEVDSQAQEVSEKIIDNDLKELKKSYDKADKYHLPTGSDNVIKIGLNQIDCSITLPATLSGLGNQSRGSKGQSIYQDDTGKFTNQVKITDLGLEVLTVLKSQDAPNAYDFETGTAGSVRLETSTESDDVILVYNNDGLVIAVVENLLAKDANGKAVGTVLNIRDNTITQRIATGDNNFSYPITSGINVYSTRSSADLLDWFDELQRH